MGLANNWSGQGSQLGSTTQQTLGPTTITGAVPTLTITDTQSGTWGGSGDYTGIYGKLTFRTSDTSGIGAHEVGYVAILDDTAASNSTPRGCLSFGVAGTNSAASEKMRLDGSGCLGLGTTLTTSTYTANLALLGNSSAGGTGLPTLVLAAYGSSQLFGQIIGYGARGSEASPTTIQADDFMLWMGGKGYVTSSGFISGTKGVIGIAAEAAWTSSSTPTYIAMYTTPSGSTTRTERLRIDSAGMLSQANAANSTLYSWRYNSSNKRIGVFVNGTSGETFLGYNLASTGTGDDFNYDLNGVAWMMGTPEGDSTFSIYMAASGTAGNKAFDASSVTAALSIDSSGNVYIPDKSLMIGTSTIPAGGTDNALVLRNGAVGDATADIVQVISDDLSAGNTILALRTEGTGITGAGVTSTTVTHKVALKINGTVYYLLATTNGT